MSKEFPMSLSRRTLLGTVGAAALAMPSLALAQNKQLRAGVITPPGHPWNEALLRVAETLKNETNGRLTMSVFPAGQLGNEGAMLQQMQSGALDLGFISVELGTRLPTQAAVNAPYVVRSTKAAAAFVRHPVVLGTFEQLPRELGTVGLSWGITSQRVVFTAKPINGLADLKGMKLRINMSPAFKDFYQLLGVAPTPIPTPAVFDAMSNGQVDGLEADLDFSWNQRFDKVSKSILRMNAVFVPGIAMASGRVWQSLSAADRELITKATKAAFDTQVDEVVTSEPKLVESFKATGIKFIDKDDADIERIVKAFDEIWLPKAPILAKLREVGASL